MDIAAILKENEWIEQELFAPGSVENSIWVSNTPKRDLITKWADNLEKLHQVGQYQNDLNTISTYISDKLRDADMVSAIHYVRHSLDHKFKRPYEMSDVETFDEDTNGSENRLNSSEESKHANRIFTSFLKRTRDEIDKDIKRLEGNVFYENKIPQDEIDQLYLQWDSLLLKHQEAWDGR